jgi:hypothetical protein
MRLSESFPRQSPSHSLLIALPGVKALGSELKSLPPGFSRSLCYDQKPTLTLYLTHHPLNFWTPTNGYVCSIQLTRGWTHALPSPTKVLTLAQAS